MLHGNIRSMYVLMMTAERAGTRLLGTFYRVGFYGAAFGDLGSSVIAPSATAFDPAQGVRVGPALHPGLLRSVPYHVI